MVRIFILILRFAIPVAIGFGLWRLLRPKWGFTINADQSGVRSHRGITTPEQRRLLEMFSKVRFVEGPVKICGRTDQNGRLQLQFFGEMSDEAKQQVRNFLTNNL